MSSKFTFFEPIILIGGGPVSASQIDLARRYATKTIAADSGADTADAMGLDVFAVLGDLDSISPKILAKNRDKVQKIADQDTTDFEKCIYASDAPLYLAIGFLGGRLDHELAALNVLAKYPDRKIILIGSEDICFFCPQKLRLDLPQNTRVSLFPLGEVTAVRSSGLGYDMVGLDMAADARIGTSNFSTDPIIEISYQAGPLLMLLPVDHLNVVVDLLLVTKT
ncbi:MAG: thiamine diphosphokinase [Rhodobacteraceae bacterium]|nr:thiamine diphosphokinase [Paracoccaceae bacterium]